MKQANLRPDPDRLGLVIIDMQDRLAAAMPQDAMQKVIRNTSIWIEAAKEFHFPIILTEQYPRGLGATVNEIRTMVDDIQPVEKMGFSCLREPGFVRALEESKARRLILCGMETHVCVYQTALDLLEGGMDVFLPADAVCSRTKFNWKTGLNMIHNAGGVVGSTEAFLFQLLKEAGTERFKKFSKLLR